MGRFIVIGERIHVADPDVRRAFEARDPESLLRRCEEQLRAGADYIDVNIGPAESDGEARMRWAVQVLQERFNGVPLSLDTANRRALEAGLRVYDRSRGRPIVNSADAGERLDRVALAADYGAIAIALCSADGVAADNDERMLHCQRLLEEGLARGMEAEDMWFDPLFLVAKGMQDRQAEVLEAIGLLSGMGLNTTGGLSNCSSGMPDRVRPVFNSCMLAMAMARGLTSAILNPNDPRVMETVKTCDVIRNDTLYADAYLEL